MNALSNVALLGAFARHPRRHPTYLGYVNGFIYGFGMGASTILFPLYAIDQGFSLSSQGFIVAAPGIVMIMLRLVGGALSDRFGEKFILWFSFSTVTLASMVPVFSGTFISLTVAQLFNGASRSVYWSAAQSYISRSAEGEAGKVMGRQLAFESSGGIIGGVVAGFIAEGVGYPEAFLMTAVATFIGFIVTSSLPRLARKDQVRSFAASLAPAKTMLVKRTLLHAHMVAFISAAYIGLVMGLFVAFFREVDYSESETALVIRLNSIGVSVLAYFFGMILGRLGSRLTAMLGITITGVLAAGVGLTGDVPVVPVVFMAITGMTFGSLRSLYPTLAAENSEPNQRAMALSVVGLYWAIGIFLSPLLFGFLAEETSIKTSIYIFSAFAVVIGLLSPVLYAYGRRGLPAEGEEERSEDERERVESGEERSDDGQAERATTREDVMADASWRQVRLAPEVLSDGAGRYIHEYVRASTIEQTHAFGLAAGRERAGSYPAARIEKHLNDRDRQGWRLVSIEPHWWYERQIAGGAMPTSRPLAIIGWYLTFEKR